MSKLSVVLATYNEEENIAKCLSVTRDIADEIVIVDGSSEDRTVEIAKMYGARILIRKNHPIFHINKQLAIDEAKNKWILQLDADEIVTKRLSEEILKVIEMSDSEVEIYQTSLRSRKLFLRHQKLIEERDGRVGDNEGPFNAFSIPRRNFFLGRYLKYGGTYPDPAIRLIKKGFAYLPAEDVHEQMTVKGRVGWLESFMLHKDSPNFSRYLMRNDRYINLLKDELVRKRVKKDLFQIINFFVIKPVSWFLMTQIRHKGILDGYQGIIFSFFSSLRFPRAYMRYLRND